jgi:hypothetical protein
VDQRDASPDAVLVHERIESWVVALAHDDRRLMTELGNSCGNELVGPQVWTKKDNAATRRQRIAQFGSGAFRHLDTRKCLPFGSAQQQAQAQVLSEPPERRLDQHVGIAPRAQRCAPDLLRGVSPQGRAHKVGSHAQPPTDAWHEVRREGICDGQRSAYDGVQE